ncbi:hypothetical protein BSL82_04655 [Tardibacter chloracetimidivorans]|uniref:VOC domain-containing protein n=1 Tax=Tardibacter chloracetimidivorans TaxID=1921510 RepID=A0A1L3ZSW6_9SPHN|nr:VOC family protein [Tardibacter chloracetimidivorans]API58690.1 hypothetical protein BSL82_04655 [Tardibacter chloracetimidivorans]
MSLEKQPLLIGNPFQVAYVTTDIDQAIEMFRKTYGLRDMLVWRDVSIDVTTPHGPGTSRMDVAFAWIKDLMYEIVRPISGPVDFYKEHLPDDGFGLAFHHLAFEITGDRDDWNRFRDCLPSDKSIPVVGPSDYPVQFLYTDERPWLGHYHEYVWFGPGAQDLFKDVPRF